MEEIKTSFDIYDYFKGDYISSLREGFPYPVKNCRFCEREMDLVDAIHIQDMLHEYKALYICLNPDCGAYDEEARQAYVRTYYSSKFAYEHLERVRIHLDVPKVEENDAWQILQEGGGR